MHRTAHAGKAPRVRTGSRLTTTVVLGLLITAAGAGVLGARRNLARVGAPVGRASGLGFSSSASASESKHAVLPALGGFAAGPLGPEASPKGSASEWARQ